MNQSPFKISAPINYAFNAFYTHWRAIVRTLFPLFVPVIICAGLRHSVGLFAGNINSYDHAVLVMLGVTTVVLFIMACGLLPIWLSWLFTLCTRLSLDIYDGKPTDRQITVSSMKKSALSICGTLCIMFFTYCAFIASVVLIVYAIRPFAYDVNILQFFQQSVTGILVAVSAFILIFLLHVKVIFSSFFIVDKDSRAMESLRSSYQLTHNSFWLIVIIGMFFEGLNKGLSLCGEQIHAGLLYVFSALLGTTSMNITVFIINTCSTCISVFCWSMLFCLSCLACAYMYRKLTEEQEQRSVVE